MVTRAEQKSKAGERNLSVCAHVSVYTFVSVCICVCLCVHACLLACACVYTYVSACVCARMYICVSGSVCTCVYVCVFMSCVCVYICGCLCAHACVCARVFTDMLASLVEGFRNLISGLALALRGRSLVPLLMPGVSPRAWGQALHLIHVWALICLARASHKLSISLVLEGVCGRPLTVGTGADERP